MKLWTDLQVEDLTKHGCNLLNDYLITYPSELEELKICQTSERMKVAARSWVIEGEKLAREHEVNKAVTVFEKAIKWNPDFNLNPNLKVWAQSLSDVEKLIEEGTKLAREGKIEQAVERYEKAIILDKMAFIPTKQNIYPEAQAKYQAVDAANALLVQGSELVREGKVKEAIASYKEAEKIQPTQISASHWKTLCWYGSLYQQAADVLFACEKAIALNPDDISLLDLRGLARALTGDIQGAIEDFQVYVEWTDDQEKKAQRQEWIKVLQAGENPFNYEILESLRNSL